MYFTFWLLIAYQLGEKGVGLWLASLEKAPENSWIPGDLIHGGGFGLEGDVSVQVGQIPRVTEEHEGIG